jgi:thiosulfate dehydrogenase [quinone] large subunit
MPTAYAEGSEKLSRISLGLFRMAFGLLWLDMAFQKAPWIVQGGHRFGWLYGWIQKEVEHPTLGLYKVFLQSVVLPNFNVFGLLTFFTEIALGVSLLVGLFTVLGGIGGALWQVNIALGSFSVPGEWYWTWFLLIAPQLVFAATRSGRTLGYDGWLLARLSRDGKGQAGLGVILARLV